MNIPVRIAQLERLLADVSLRRGHAEAAAPVRAAQEAAVAGWSRLELGVRTALESLKRQPNLPEYGR